MRAFIIAVALAALVAIIAGCKTQPTPPPTKAAATSNDISAPFTDNTVYEVQPGETLQTIAVKVYGDESRWKAIYYCNYSRLRTPEDLRPKMKILLPPKDQPPYYEYTVQKGDTLSSIALEWYSDKAKSPILAEENQLADPDHIVPGQVLKIPVLK
jgi:nucleoid-associated protein YgaU